MLKNWSKLALKTGPSMLRNKIGPIFNARNVVFFCFLFLIFFWKILFFLQGEWDFQKQKNKKDKKLDQFLTLEKAKIGPVFNSTAYIYICARCGVKNWSINCLFWVKKWSKCSLFFLVVLFVIFFFLQGEMRFFKTTAPKELGTLFVNTAALTERMSFSCVFAASGFSAFFWGEEWKAKITENKTTKINKTTRCKQ